MLSVCQCCHFCWSADSQTETVRWCLLREKCGFTDKLQQCLSCWHQKSSAKSFWQLWENWTTTHCQFVTLKPSMTIGHWIKLGCTSAKSSWALLRKVANNTSLTSSQKMEILEPSLVTIGHWMKLRCAYWLSMAFSYYIALSWIVNNAFITELANVGCILWPQWEHIIHIAQPRDRNDKLFEFLTRRSVHQCSWSQTGTLSASAVARWSGCWHGCWAGWVINW